MAQLLTKSAARNIFYGGVCFSSWYFSPSPSTPPRRCQARQPPEPDAAGGGRQAWCGSRNNCIGCHTLLGEGAYFAPELGNVYTRLRQQHGSNQDLHQVPPAKRAGAPLHAAVQSHRGGAENVAQF